MKKSKIQIFNHEDDGFQLIYIDNELWADIHFNDDQLGGNTLNLLESLGHDVDWLQHEDIPEEHRDDLLEKGLIDE